ncbi:cysteine hydrolase family protein [Streptomyces sp. SBT349]|uniref:cysteine hydrolase family protein n=1 Tax=Streptomyces sp. SBT349 TaxID=1580539 RepID=UPI00066EB063|nr:isochorismatase family cysteine hydrolase [Streptomyces sp. SBT349]
MKRSTSTPSSGSDVVAGPGTGDVTRFGPGDAVLVVVDVQNDFCHPEGTMGRRGLDLSAVAPAVANAELLIGAARGAGVPVVFVRTVHGDHVDSPEWTHRHAGGIGPGFVPAEPNCVEGTWGAEFHRVAPLPGEPVFVKHRYSAFGVPAFRAWLAACGRRSLVFAGVTTNVCVETSLRAAVDHDVLGSVAEDACAAYDAAEHAASVAVIARHFGKAARTGEIVECWRSTCTAQKEG